LIGGSALLGVIGIFTILMGIYLCTSEQPDNLLFQTQKPLLNNEESTIMLYA
jgi:hypothetical protein